MTGYFVGGHDREADDGIEASGSIALLRSGGIDCPQVNWQMGLEQAHASGLLKERMKRRDKELSQF